MMVSAMFRQFSAIFLVSMLMSVLACSSGARALEQPDGTWKYQAELSAKEAVNGSVLLVKITETPPTVSAADIIVHYQGRDYPVFKFQNGFEAVLGVPYDKPLGLSKVEILIKKDMHSLPMTLPFTVKDGNYPSEELKVDASHVNPKKADLLRIR